jgi:hypothetical protein
MNRSSGVVAGCALLLSLAVGGVSAQSPSPSPAGQSPSPGDASPAPPTNARGGHDARIHSGTCANPGEVVARLEDVRRVRSRTAGEASPAPGAGAASPAPGAPATSPTPATDGATPSAAAGIEASISRVPLRLRQILQDPHVIAVHERGEALESPLVCGELSGGLRRGVLVVPLQEQGTSGYKGVAFLQPDDQRTRVYVSLTLPDDAGMGLEDGVETTMSPESGSTAPSPSPAASPPA